MYMKFEREIKFTQFKKIEIKLIQKIKPRRWKILTIEIKEIKS